MQDISNIWLKQEWLGQQRIKVQAKLLSKKIYGRSTKHIQHVSSVGVRSKSLEQYYI